MKYGFIYIWFDKNRKMFYVGCHWGTEDDGYVCSSNRMRDAYRRRPQDFKRRILKTNLGKDVLILEEYKWLKLIKQEELGKKYYNYKNCLFPNAIGVNIGKKCSSETKKRISESKKGQVPWNIGKSHSYETIQKMKKIKTGKIQSEETINKRIEKLKGIPRSEETKQKISEKNRGSKRTEEAKLKMSLSKIGKPSWRKGKTFGPRNEETKRKISETMKRIFLDLSPRIL